MEDFLALLDGVTAMADTQELLERARARAEKLHKLEGRHARVLRAADFLAAEILHQYWVVWALLETDAQRGEPWETSKRQIARERRRLVALMRRAAGYLPAAARGPRVLREERARLRIQQREERIARAERLRKQLEGAGFRHRGRY